MQNAVNWSATPLLGLLLCVPVIGQFRPLVGPIGTRTPSPGDAQRRLAAARDPLGESDDSVRAVAERLAQLRAATEGQQETAGLRTGADK